MTPEAIVQKQLETYNARDLEAYLALFSETIRTYRPPSTEPVLDGKQALREFYATQRFNKPDLHARLINRMALGNIVIDHELITGVSDEPMEMAAVYEVKNNLIQHIWFYMPLSC